MTIIPDKFEYDRVRAGHWRIEGYDIERRGEPGKPRWQVLQTPSGEPERFFGWRRTLQAAIDEIVIPLVENRGYKKTPWGELVCRTCGGIGVGSCVCALGAGTIQ